MEGARLRPRSDVRRRGRVLGTADFNLKLTGMQRDDASFWVELLSALTLTIFPYSVSHEYDLHYAVEDVRTGAKYSAAIEGEDESQVELFLLITWPLPLSRRGHDLIMERMGDHRYDQLHRQGAFAQPASAGVSAETR